MAQLLNPHNGVLLLSKMSFFYNSSSCTSSISQLLRQKKSCSHIRKDAESRNNCWSQTFSPGSSNVADHVKRSPDSVAYVCDRGQSDIFPHIQTLRRFPREELVAKVVLVRFDSTILLGTEVDPSSRSVSNALFTIRYLHEVGAKLILLSDWSKNINSKSLAAESVADILSSVLHYNVVRVQCISCNILLDMEVFKKADIILLENLSEFKEEVANCPKFAELLSSGVDIFVNDSFFRSHKILASTVGVTRFCSASLAGFHFEESLSQLKKAAKLDKKPYVAIIGGGNLYNKAAALHFLASRCDGLVFVGMMSFQIMHALGLSISSNLMEKEAYKVALDLIQFASDKNMTILYPKDFWCMNKHHPKQLEIFPAQSILEGWVPVDLGPQSVEEINSLIMECKKIIWIGPVKFRLSSQFTNGALKLARMLCKLSQGECDVTVVGSVACKAITKESSLGLNVIENASVVWEFLKGRKLPGVLALDRVHFINLICICLKEQKDPTSHEAISDKRVGSHNSSNCFNLIIPQAYPFEIDWNAAYCDPSQPLVVDIGSGNGLFLLGMARKREDLNFLGLEINAKLVRRCLDSVQLSGITNGYFIATNATSTFRSIVSSYPGKLILVSLQCPNPDFNKPEHRWRMLQRSLVEAVADLLAYDGKVFMQSDIEEVAVRMKEQFLKFGKNKIAHVQDQCDIKIDQGPWLEENPFGVRSDWEQHVIDRGDPMYRLMLSKSTSVE